MLTIWIISEEVENCSSYSAKEDARHGLGNDKLQAG